MGTHDGGLQPEMDDWFLRVHEYLYTRDTDGAEEARLIVRALGLGPGSRVLDAPSAAGRIAVHLARAGCRVTCVDINERFLAQARERLHDEGLPGSVCAMDLRRLAFRGEFDAAYNWWASFGYFSEEGNLQALRSMAAALKPGGRLIIEQPNRQHLLRHFVADALLGPWRLHSVWDAKRERLDSHWVLVKDGRDEHYPMSMRWYTPAQFRDLFGRAGLVLEQTYGAYDGSPYRPSSRQLIVVGRKG